ncbi:hypothetical protein BDV11DRAFT_196072 [Aspergillus similis]
MHGCVSLLTRWMSDIASCAVMPRCSYQLPQRRRRTPISTAAYWFAARSACVFIYGIYDFSRSNEW